MKTLLIIMLIVICSALNATMPQAWTEFQKDLGMQAAQYQNSPAHQSHKQSRINREYVVGSTETFWRWNLSVMPPTWVQATATCRAVGEHSYIFVADSEWNNHMTQANVDTILVRLEDNTPNNPNQGAIEMDINLFGQIPDELDNDSRLIVFYSALGSFQGSMFDGYFSPYNQVTEAEAQQMNPSGHSNECEMIYMTCYPLSPVAPIRLSVLAHELEHLIHWGQDANEETWIDEGCAELAMVAYGVPDPVSGFPSNPDNSLNVWNQQTADYVKVMLFFTYLQEHYDASGMIADLVADPANGIASLSSQLGIHYPDTSLAQLLSNWSAANVIDAMNPWEGLLNYTEFDLPNFSMTNMNTSPNQSSQTVNAYATDYLKYSLTDGGVTFNLESSDVLRVMVLLYDATNTCFDILNIGSTNSYQFSSLPAQTSRFVVVLTNAGASTVSYSYGVGSVGNQDDTQNGTPAIGAASISCYPNPFTASGTAMQISIKYDGLGTHGKLDIYNLKGQHIRSLQVQKAADSQTYSAVWDGRNMDDKSVGNGSYLLRYTVANKQVSKAVFLIK